MGGLFSKPKIPKPEPLPKPDAPIAMGTAGEAETNIKQRLVKAGRGGTILAGPLSPSNIGKKTLG